MYLEADIVSLVGRIANTASTYVSNMIHVGYSVWQKVTT